MNELEKRMKVICQEMEKLETAYNKLKAERNHIRKTIEEEENEC